MITTEIEKKRSGATLLLKCALAALPLIIFISLFAWFPMRFFNIDYPMWLYQKQRINEQTIDADVIVLGDSLMMSGVEPELWGDDIQNLALGGATPIDMEYTLETYLNNHSAPKLVIMGFGHNHYLDLSSYWNRTVYFHYLPLSFQLRLITRARNLGDTALLESEDLARDTCRFAVYSPIEYLPAFLAALSTSGRAEENRTIYKDCVQSRGYFAFGKSDSCDIPSMSIDYNEFNIAPLMDAYLRSILCTCEENDINVVLERPPYNQASEDAMDATLAEQYAAYLESLAADFPGAIVNTQIDVYPDDCFGDECGHLNQNGAERYTKSLYERYAYLAES